MQKNKIFSIILALCLIMPASVMAEDIYSNILNQPQQAESQVEQTVPAAQQSESAVKNNTQAVQNPSAEAETFKQPISRRKIAKKFLAAMGGVVISSLLIFFILSLYNRIREKILNQVKTPEGETSLETPNNLEGAVKTFLEKTDWEQ